MNIHGNIYYNVLLKQKTKLIKFNQIPGPPSGFEPETCSLVNTEHRNYQVL